MKQVIHTEKAPTAIGPYSQAVWSGELLFLSGQTATDPGTGGLVAGDVQDQARQSLENIKAVLSAAGLTMSHVVKTTVFITDMANFAKINEVYAQYFPKPYPARSCVAVVALPKAALVEIEAVAARQAG
jgi:2-iminobutanoate/2-iminopropanoate deaminase